MNPSDDKAPDGVVVTEVMWDAGEDALDEGLTWFSIREAMLAAAPPPASPDERLKGLREALAKLCEGMADQRVDGQEYSDVSAAVWGAHMKMAKLIRFHQIEAAQKDQRAAPQAVLAARQTPVSDALHRSVTGTEPAAEVHQQAAQPEAAVGSGGPAAWLIFYEDADARPEVFMGAGAEEGAKRRFKEASTNWNCHLFRTAEHYIPAAREDGPSQLSIIWARDLVSLRTGWTPEREAASELLRWHKQTRGKVL